jgi:hypothetical protein
MSSLLLLTIQSLLVEGESQNTKIRMDTLYVRDESGGMLREKKGFAAKSGVI